MNKKKEDDELTRDLNIVPLDRQVLEALDDIIKDANTLKRWYKVRGSLAKKMRKMSLESIWLRNDALLRAEKEGKFD